MQVMVVMEEEVGCAIVGLERQNDRIAMTFKEQRPGTDWLNELKQKDQRSHMVTPELWL